MFQIIFNELSAAELSALPTALQLSLLAELYFSIVMGWTSRLSQLGVAIDREALDRRLREAVKLFIRGAVVSGP